MWSTRKPLNYLVGDGFGGDNGAPAYVEITYQPVGELATIKAIPAESKVVPPVPAGSYTPVLRSSVADIFSLTITDTETLTLAVGEQGPVVGLVAGTTTTVLTSIPFVGPVAGTTVPVQGPVVGPVAGNTTTVLTSIPFPVTQAKTKIGPTSISSIAVRYNSDSDILEIAFSDPLRATCKGYEISFTANQTPANLTFSLPKTKTVSIVKPGSSVASDRCNVTPTATQKLKITSDGFLAVFTEVVIGRILGKMGSYKSTLESITVTIKSTPLPNSSSWFEAGELTVTKVLPNPVFYPGSVSV